MGPAPLDPELYLAHARHVRALARALVFDEHRAADVAQQAWLAALGRAPRDAAAVRAWLRALVRNFAIKAWRSEARRARREEAVARGCKQVSTPAEILEQETARRRVVDALLALEEPYRTALTLRFFDELEPHEIAARLDLPVDTVRTRVRRGLERLRLRLQRGGCSVALLVGSFRRDGPATAARPPASHTPWSKGMLSMSKTQTGLFAAVAVLAVACAIVIALPALDASGEHPPVRTAGAVAATSARLVGADAAPARIAAPGRILAPTAGTDVAPPALVAADGELAVRVIWADGTVAAGVDTFVRSSGSAALTMRPLRMRTAADGTFHIARLAAGVVTVQPDRGGEGSVRLAAGARAQLEVTIPTGVDLAGRTVDAGGAPVAGARVFLWYGRRKPYEECEVARSDADGRFLVRAISSDLAVGLGARAAGRAPTRRHDLVTAAGVVDQVVLVFEGAGHTLEGRVVDERSAPVADALVLVGPAASGARRRQGDGSTASVPAGQLVRTDAHGRFQVDGVAAGATEVRVRAAGLAAWQGTANVPGEATVHVMLHRGARVRGCVRDSGGAPVANALVRSGGDPTIAFGDALATTAADGSYVLADVAPGETLLRAAHPVRGEAATTLHLASGSEQVWDAMLGRAQQIHGRVELAGGPLAGWNVGLDARGYGAADGPRFVPTDADGRFVFAACTAVAHRLFASPPGDVFVVLASLDGVRPGSGEVVLHPDPHLLPSVRIVGRAVGADGRPVAGAALLPYTPRALHSNALTSDAFGRFAIGPLPPGTWNLQVAAPACVTRELPARHLAAGDTWDVGDVVLDAGGSVTAIVRPDPGRTSEVEAVQILAADTDWGGWLERSGDVWRSGTLAPGRYRLVPSGTEVALAGVDVDVRAGEGVRAEVPLRRGWPVTWTCRDEQGRAPAGHVALAIRDAQGTLLLRKTVRPERGQLTVTAALLGGSYRITATTRDGRAGSLVLAVGDGPPAQPLELILFRR